MTKMSLHATKDNYKMPKHWFIYQVNSKWSKISYIKGYKRLHKILKSLEHI